MPSFFNSILQMRQFRGSRTVYESGSSISASVKNSKLPLLALCLSLFLVGSCNESASIFDFSKKPNDLQQLTKSERVRYGHALQAAILQSPDDITKLQASEVKLALSSPDLEREDGYNKVWQYRGQDCVLDVYWQKINAQTPISHFEIRQRRSVLDGTQAVIEPVKWQCIQNIIQQRRDDIDEGFREAYADLSLKAHKS